MTDDERNVFDRISHKYYDLTEAERKAADYVAVNQREVQLMSISELAECCGVAEATVTRFCRRLGYKGYSAFKLALANSTARFAREELMMRRVETDDSIPTLAAKLCAVDIDALDQTVALVRPEAVLRAADMLSEADRVLCMGQGGSGILARAAAHLFSTALPGFESVMDSHLQAIAITHLTSKDAVLFYSYSGSTREVTELLPLARSRGAGTVLVTRFPKSPAAAYADVILQCGANELPLQHGSAPALMSQLFLTDLLFAEIYRRNQQQCAEARERVSAALSGKHL